MKECDFRSKPNLFPELTSDELLKKICNGEYFGAAVCDVYVPDRLKAYFAEMPPVFKNVEVTVADVGPYMKNICETLDEFKTARRSLIGSYFGEQIMVASPLIRWYSAHGIIVKNITCFVRYDPIRCFQKLR